MTDNFASDGSRGDGRGGPSGSPPPLFRVDPGTRLELASVFEEGQPLGKCCDRCRRVYPMGNDFEPGWLLHARGGEVGLRCPGCFTSADIQADR